MANGYRPVFKDKMSRIMTNQQNDMCAQRRLRSAWASTQSDQIHSVWSVFTVSMRKHCVLDYPKSTQRRLWSDWVDAQADLSLRWAHMSFCWFCRAAAQLSTRRKWLQYPLATEWSCFCGDHYNSDHAKSINTSETVVFFLYKSRLMTKPTKWLCAQRRLRSALASAQSDQSIRCALNG